jgi:hypothetical protein
MVHMVDLMSKAEDIEAVGRSLAEYSRHADFTAQRGVVDELFPYIVQASQRMSARAISRFLQEKHGVKVSYVTIGRALRQPEKSWNLFFDDIQASARIYGRLQRVALKDFLFEETFQEPAKNRILRAAVQKVVEPQFLNAVQILRDKWFSLGLEIRLKARPYLERRLG